MGNVKNNILIPQVSTLRKKQEKGPAHNKKQTNKLSDFEKLLKQRSDDIQVSNHAAKRMKERNIQIDSEDYLKMQDAVSKLRDKGGKESLIITKDAAYIVDVSKGTIVTAVDKDNMADNVFTKIDSTVIL